MININNKHELEIAFSKNFGSPYFPILADIYMREGDIDRSKRVCEIGLQHCPENNFGKFILAKIAIAEEKPAVAERWLKQVVSENPGNFKALRMLIRLEVLLKRSIKTIQSYINIILERLPEDKECHALLDALNNHSSTSALKTTTTYKSLPKKENKGGDIEKTKASTIESINYKLEKSMATLSMLTILKKQKHYKQALVVLNILESKNIDPPRIIKEKQEIQSLIKHSSSTE
jgi:hypothetical protein